MLEQKDISTEIFSLSFCSSLILLLPVDPSAVSKTINASVLDGIIIFNIDKLCSVVFGVNENVKNGILATIKCGLSNEDDKKALLKTYISKIKEDCSKELFNKYVEKTLFTLVWHNKSYDGRFRFAFELFWISFGNLIEDFYKLEVQVSIFLTSCESNVSSPAGGQTISKKKAMTGRDALKIGGAATVGGILLGLTGGLAAPAIGAGIAAFSTGIGVATPAFAVAAATQSGLLITSGVFAASGAALHGHKMSNRLSKEVDEMFFKKRFSESKKDEVKNLCCCIGIHGWVSEVEGLPTTFSSQTNCFESVDLIDLVWERKINAKVGSYFKKLAVDQALGLATSEVLKHTALAGLFAAIAIPGYVIKLAQLIDNPWILSVNKAKAVGQELASIILSTKRVDLFGKRPIKFYAYSVGCIAVFECLLQLQIAIAEKEKETGKSSEIRGYIGGVTFVGAPIIRSTEEWFKVVSVCSGHFFNCYSPKDWLLSFLYRASNISSLAGVSEIKLKHPRFINYNLNDLGINLHSDYDKLENHQKIRNQLIRETQQTKIVKSMLN